MRQGIEPLIAADPRDGESQPAGWTILNLNVVLTPKFGQVSNEFGMAAAVALFRNEVLCGVRSTVPLSQAAFVEPTAGTDHRRLATTPRCHIAHAEA